MTTPKEIDSHVEFLDEKLGKPMNLKSNKKPV